jgi:hypothetical protein
MFRKLVVAATAAATTLLSIGTANAWWGGCGFGGFGFGFPFWGMGLGLGFPFAGFGFPFWNPFWW